MGDHRRLFVPALLAVVFHGLLIGFTLPQHDPVRPLPMESPVSIEITTFSRHVQPPSTNREEEQAAVVTEPVVAPQVAARPQPATRPQPAPALARPATQTEDASLKQPASRPVTLQQRHQKVVRSIVPKQATVTEPPVAARAPAHRQEKKERAKQTGQQGATAAKNEVSTQAAPKDLQQGNASPSPGRQTAIPRYRQNSQPPYPVMARRRGYEGEVLLRVLVNTSGSVAEIKIKRSSQHPSLDQAAVTTVKNWSFIPASEDGRPVSLWIDIPIAFRLTAGDNG
ncbi:MAG: TonB family protein [Desulfopila sp.]